MGTYGNVFAVSVGDSLELLQRTANDVDFGSIDGKGLCCHYTDTRATTGDDNDSSLDIEQVLELELIIVV